MYGEIPIILFVKINIKNDRDKILICLFFVILSISFKDSFLIFFFIIVIREFEIQNFFGKIIKAVNLLIQFI